MFFDDEAEKPSVVNFGDIQIEKLDALEAGIENYEIFNEDFESMGTAIGTNVMMLHMHHPNSEPARYITLIHKPTGQRIRITFPYEEEKPEPKPELPKKRTRTRITRNAVRCKECGDVIESKHVHDFVWCSCGTVAVDGGHEYLRRCGDFSDMEDLSESMEVEE
jgi:hypothetical protein